MTTQKHIQPPTDVETAERRAALYSHPSSRERRAEEERGPAKGPKVDLRRRHLDERNELAVKHRAESEKLQMRHNREIGDEVAAFGGNPSFEIEQRHKREVDDLLSKHARERTTMGNRHAAERRKL